MKAHILTKNWVRTTAVSVLGLLVALLVLSILLHAAGRDTISTLRAIFVGAFGSKLGLTETLSRMTPLLLCALAAAIPAKAGLFNIGGEGQLHLGAIGATGVLICFPSLPHFAVIPSMILLALLGGAIWGLIPGLLRGWLKVNEVLVSLMLNYVAIALVEHLVYGPWRDQSALGWPYTISFPEWAVLPTLGKSNIHLGLLLGIAAVALAYFLMKRTTWGFSVRVVEANIRTANYAGIRVGHYAVVLMALGGAMAGLAGLGEVSVIQGRLRPNISPGYGYTGFLITWLARRNLFAIVPVAFIVGGFYSGSDALQLSAGLPSATVDIFMGLVFLTLLGNEIISRRQIVEQREGSLS